MLTYMRHIAGLDLQIFMKNVLSINDHDAWPALPSVSVPTLVVAAERDAFTPMWLSRKIVSTIPGAEFMELAEGTHAALIEQPETILRRLDRFIAERAVFGASA